MAIPTNPIEVWAYEDYILPNTHELNKERPIDDLWKKGYDMGQKPSAEHWNYMFNLLSDWVRYLNDDKIPGLDGRYFQISNNLSEVVDKVALRSNIEVYSKQETDAADSLRVLKEGDTMTGPLNLPRINFLAADSDQAWISTTIPTADTTYLDIGIGDNAGDQSLPTGVDKIRFRFKPESGSEFSMVEINSVDGTTGYLRVLGQLRATRLDIDGNAGISGQLAANTLYANASLDANSLNVRANNAVVGGRNVVRTLNGISADGNGNISYTPPPTGVVSVRLGAQYNKGYAGSNPQFADPGGVLTGLQEYASDNEIHQYYFRPIQVTYDNINWFTVSQS